MIILTVFFTRKIGVIVKTDASDFSYIVHATQTKNVLLLRVETIHLIDIVLHINFTNVYQPWHNYVEKWLVCYSDFVALVKEGI